VQVVFGEHFAQGFRNWSCFISRVEQIRAKFFFVMTQLIQNCPAPNPMPRTGLDKQTKLDKQTMTVIPDILQTAADVVSGF
jgi:hypothetical protein